MSIWRTLQYNVILKESLSKLAFLFMNDRISSSSSSDACTKTGSFYCSLSFCLLYIMFFFSWQSMWYGIYTSRHLGVIYLLTLGIPGWRGSRGAIQTHIVCIVSYLFVCTYCIYIYVSYLILIERYKKRWNIV